MSDELFARLKTCARESRSARRPPGRSVDRQNWHVTESAAGLDLIIHDSSRVTHRLHPATNGSWLGERLSFPRSGVRVDARSVREPIEHARGLNGLVQSLVAAAGLHEGGSKEARQQLRGVLQLLLRAEPAARAALLDLASGSPDLAGIVRELVERQDQRKPRAVGPVPRIVQTHYEAPGDSNP
ncbi:MAG: hypothetical protein K2Z80_04160 [Xanthobacteraceae bacterium]|nr:hypothetical protein [Xanthobacteraceae bacterium]